MPIQVVFDGLTVTITGSEEEMAAGLRASRRALAERAAPPSPAGPAARTPVTPHAEAPREASPLSPVNGVVQAITPVEHRVPPPEQWAGLMGRLNPRQRRALATIRAHSGATLIELAKLLGFDTPNPVLGFLTPTRKHIENAEMVPEDVFRREESGAGRNKVSRYYAGPALVAYEVPVEDPGEEAEAR